MKRNPLLISVYATVYNNSKLVRRSILSIINNLKSFKDNFEFVVVDNYSDDGTYETINDLAKLYPNIKVIRKKCTRGAGRAIAYNNTSGYFVFNVDLDTIYSNNLGKIIKNILKVYKTNQYYCVPFGFEFMDYKTMNKIGNWPDLNTSEDSEFDARAISKGITRFEIPVHLAYNEIIKNRERRYAKNRIRFIKRKIRLIKDAIIGIGFKNLKEVKRSKFSSTVLFKIMFIYLKLTRVKISIYSNFSSNLEYVQMEKYFLNPHKLGINKKYWVGFIPTGIISNYAIFKQLGLLIKLGFNRIVLLGNGSILCYTNLTDNKIISYYKKQFSK